MNSFDADNLILVPYVTQAVQKRWFYFVDSPQRYQIEFFLRYSVPSSILSTLSLSGNEKLKQSVCPEEIQL